MCIYPNKTMGIVYIEQWALLWLNNMHRLYITMGIVLVLRMLIRKVRNKYWLMADMLYSSTNTFISWLPPVGTRQAGHKPRAEYTRRSTSNMCVKGGVCIMPTTRGRVLSVIGGLTFLCFLGLHVIITPRTQHTLFTGLVHRDKVPATPAYTRADLYGTTKRQRISMGAIVSYLQKLRILKTSDVLKQFFFL